MIIQLDDQIIPQLPYTWRMALTQGSTGIIAAPSEDQIENIVKLANDLVPIIQSIGSCTVTSWLRTPEHNIAVGGSTHSAHLLGAGVDLSPNTKTVDECKVLIKAMLNRVLFYEINTTNWIHVDFIHNHDFIA